MKSKNVHAVLQNIQNKYQRIRQMTEMLDENTAPEALLQVVEQRAGMLTEIEREQAYLEHMCRGWRNECEKNPVLATLKNEIQLLIAAAVALDSMIQNSVSRKMHAIKMEMATFHHTSKAVLSYTRQSY